MRIPRISLALHKRLRMLPQLPMSNARPGVATLKDGRTLKRVLFTELDEEPTPIPPMIGGFNPESEDPVEAILGRMQQDNLKQMKLIARRWSLDIRLVADVKPSPQVMPFNAYEKIRGAGETGMGYHIFNLHLRDGRKLRCFSLGDFLFPHLPRGISTDMIVDATPLPRGTQGPFASGDAKHMSCTYLAPRRR